MGKRSNGCITCRKRKVKCDETKPTCIRCSKATYNCKGYDQPWLDETPFIALARERAAKRAREHRESQNALLPDGDVQSVGFLSAKSVAESINLSAFREDICRSFLLHRLSAGPDHSKAMSWWLNPSPKAEVQSRTLVSASKAMSAAFFGRVNQQAKIITEGVLMYGEALRNLSKDLSHPIKAYTFETLGATMALTMYELVHMRAGTPGWISHAGGIGKLIEARGPQLHKTYPEKTIYLESRMLLVANGIFACQATFLEESKWKNVPWEDDIPMKTPFDYLVDVLSDIPSFLQQITSNSNSYLLATGSPGAQPDRTYLQKQLFKHLETVKGLRETWHAKYSNPLCQKSPRMTPPATPMDGYSQNVIEPPFQTVLYFVNMYRAYDFLIYNTTLMLLFMLYEQVSQDLDPSSPYLNERLRTLFPNMSLQSLVRDICRCTEYMLLDIHGSRGYIVLTFPATVAYFASEKGSPEARWLHDVCKRHAGSNGFGFGDFALDQVTPLSMWMDAWKMRSRTSQPLPQGLEAPAAQRPYAFSANGLVN